MSLSFCIYYRRVNAITLPEIYPLPRIDERIQSSEDASVFQILQCNSGYWQIPVAQQDRDKTTFTSHEGTYCNRRKPFGPKNAPATFQRTLDIVVSSFRWKSCLLYMDDDITFSKVMDSHFAHVEEILEAIRWAGINLKRNK